MSATAIHADAAEHVPTDPAQPVTALLADATKLGATFTLSGAEVICNNAARLPPSLCAALRARRDDIWTHLGGDAAGRPSLDLLTRLGVTPVVPQTETEALALITEIEADADRTGGDRTGRLNIGLDIETAPLDGQEDRPSTRLTRQGRLQVLQPKPGAAALDPRRSAIRLAQLYGGGGRCLVLDTRLVPLPVLTPVLGRRIAVAHNAKFELAFLPAAGIELPRFECTMQAAGLLLGVHRRGLDDVASTYLGIDLPKGLATSDWAADTLSAGQLAYAALDAIVTLQVWRKLREELRDTDRGDAYRLQRDVTPVVARMEARGILVDRFEHQQQETSWGIALSDARQNLLALLHARQPSGTLHEDAPKITGTPAEVRRLLTTVLSPEVLDAWPRTKGGDLTTKQAELKKQRAVPEVAQLVEIAAHEKLLTNFGTRLIEQISASTGCLHASFNIAAAKTGRFTSSKPNLQQIPNKKARHFRDCVVAAPGNRLVLGDYATMELRAAAEVANDADLRQAFAEGIDLHRTQAAATLGIDPQQVTDAQREGAKPINFGVVYGMGPSGLVATAWGTYGIVLMIDEATAARDAFFARFPTLARWLRTHANECERLGRIKISRLGRVIEAAWEKPMPITGFAPYDAGDGDGDEDEDETDEVDQAAVEARNKAWSGPQVRRLRYTLCCNAPVQGACADAVMLAMIGADNALRAANVPGGLVLSVHDELVLEVPIARADEAGAILQREMVWAFVKTFPGAPTTGLVEIKQGSSWSEAKSGAGSAGVTKKDEADGSVGGG